MHNRVMSISYKTQYVRMNTAVVVTPFSSNCTEQTLPLSHQDPNECRDDIALMPIRLDALKSLLFVKWI